MTAGGRGSSNKPLARGEKRQTYNQARGNRMPLSEVQRAHVTKRLTSYCEARVPATVRDKLRLGFRVQRNEVVLFEERPAADAPHDWRETPVAKFKYVSARRTWQLYCQHRDLRWHAYRRRGSARDFDTLLAEVEADPTGIFWG